jgi:hypothetical protein
MPTYFDQILIGDVFVSKTEPLTLTVESKNEFYGTIVCNGQYDDGSSVTAAFSPEVLGTHFEAQKKYSVLYQPIFWVEEDGNVSIDFSDSFQYVYEHTSGVSFDSNVDPLPVGPYEAFDNSEDLIFDTLRAARRDAAGEARPVLVSTSRFAGREAAAFFRLLALHIDGVENSKADAAHDAQEESK